MSLKVMWHVAGKLKKSFDNLQKEPSRQCWKACTEEFGKVLQQHTKGCFSGYSIKITLDGVLLSQPCLESVVSWWPMQCTAYKQKIPELYSECRRTHSPPREPSRRVFSPARNSLVFIKQSDFLSAAA